MNRQDGVSFRATVWTCFVLFLLGGGVGAFAFYVISGAQWLGALGVWLLAAAALGLLTGYVAGGADFDAAGTAKHYFTFLSSGILLPVVGGGATLVKGSKRTAESYQYAAGELTEKVVQVSPEFDPAHPLMVIGGFILVYAAFAALGILAGASQKNESGPIMVVN